MAAEQANKEQRTRISLLDHELRETTLLVQQKDKMCEMIRGQVDMLAKELMSVQTDLIKKEKQLQSKVNRLKEEKNNELKDKKNIEARLKDLSQALQ